MSRGPGRIERAIETILTTEADNAFTIADLCQRIYPRVKRINKKHRVSILRAAKKLAQRRDTFDNWVSDTRGGAVVYYNSDNVMSYAMARFKGDFLNNYGGTQEYWPKQSEEHLRKRLAKGGKEHKLIVDGGTWWAHTQSKIDEVQARRAGDDERVKHVLAERERRWAFGANPMEFEPVLK